MRTYTIKNALVVNEGGREKMDVVIKGGFIKRVGLGVTVEGRVIDAEGRVLIPGVIDDQVHFREPGLTHKAEIKTESRAAVAGGITSYMEMPNTKPPTDTQEKLEEKYRRAAEVSYANYSFYMGATNNNLEEVLKTDPKLVCGVKVFMGSSTGNMLVDDEKTLNGIFKGAKLLVATHCEDELTIKENTQKCRDEYGEVPPISVHPIIRDAEACYKSSSLAVRLAKEFGTRLHVLHLSSGIETDLFDNSVPAKDKRITAEVCVHHLWFDDRDYDRFGTRIKWNPAVKSEKDKDKLWEALLLGKIDVIATDHAPHTLEEKENSYFKAPSGGPLVQHSLLAMLEFEKQGKISLEQIVDKMCHKPAEIFNVEHRGYIREGYKADVVLLDLSLTTAVEREDILYKCGWSPFEGTTFGSRITHTFVNGQLVFDNGAFDETVKGERLSFDR